MTKDERREKREVFFLKRPAVMYVYNCFKCGEVAEYPPEFGTKYCRCCGHKIQASLPVYDRYTHFREKL
jgi:DNA-directed RNA polymerase subunit RPC12/RpoP